MSCSTLRLFIITLFFTIISYYKPLLCMKIEKFPPELRSVIIKQFLKSPFKDAVKNSRAGLNTLSICSLGKGLQNLENIKKVNQEFKTNVTTGQSKEIIKETLYNVFPEVEMRADHPFNKNAIHKVIIDFSHEEPEKIPMLLANVANFLKFYDQLGAGKENQKTLKSIFGVAITITIDYPSLQKINPKDRIRCINTLISIIEAVCIKPCDLFIDFTQLPEKYRDLINPLYSELKMDYSSLGLPPTPREKINTEVLNYVLNNLIPHSPIKKKLCSALHKSILTVCMAASATLGIYYTTKFMYGADHISPFIAEHPMIYSFVFGSVISLIKATTNTQHFFPFLNFKKTLFLKSIGAACLGALVALATPKAIDIISMINDSFA